MRKLMCVIGIALLVVAFTGCGEKADPDESREAQNLINGVGVMGMMTNVDAYDDYTFADGPCTPPLGWSGPYEFEMPYGADSFYEFFWKPPFDSLDVTIDTLHWLVMPQPDVWGGDTMPWTGIDTWIKCINRNKIYFHTDFSIADPTYVTGTLRWQWEETWYDYQYQVSKLDESANIDITTSTNIGLSAQFRFDSLGAGTLEENFASWNNTTFVKFEFFAEDSAGWDGFYQLLSEAWKVDHLFKLIREQDAY